MNRLPVFTQSASLLAALTLLSACGPGPDPAPPPPTTATVSTRVLDGPLQNATVCLDLNDNGACDSGEPSARTGADGRASFTVDITDAGQHALVAEVGTDAIDSVSGPVTEPYVLSTPADSPAVISPLTTLVKVHVDATGLSAAAAERALQDIASVTQRLLIDYSAANTDETEALATAARLIVLAKQAAQVALQPAVGTPDVSGATISAADVNGVVNRRLLELLPSIATTTATVLDAAAGAPREAALLAAGQSLGTTELALTPDSLNWIVAFGRPAAPSPTPSAVATLPWFTYTDASNWYFRVFEATAEQNTPDANGLLHFAEKRKRAVNGAVQLFGEPAYARTDVYFNGALWFDCPADFLHTQTQLNAAGENEGRYCGAFHNKTRRSAPFDISGRSMPEVLSLIRAYPLVSTQGLYTQWGPDPATPALAGAVFPPGSTFAQFTSIQVENPDTYGTLPNQIVNVYDTSVTAGGSSVACNNVTPSTFGEYLHEIQSLEQLAAGNPGQPCLYTPNDATGPRHEWWGNSTIGMGNISGPTPLLPYYQATRNLRIAFGAGNAVTYYTCALRSSDGSPRNCDPIGTGTYTIEALGDARVMRFADVPLAARSLNYSRLFVERNGKVYFGYHSKLGIDNTLRLNGTALDALLNQLGLSR